MAFGEGFKDSEDVMSEINMIPLVDIMLVLLIIFMITMPVVTHSINVDLPQASTAQAELTPETVTITVTAQGTFEWNNAPIDRAELGARFAAAATQEPQPDILIHGDKRAEYEHVIEVMAAAQQAGLTKLGFVTVPTH